MKPIFLPTACSSATRPCGRQLQTDTGNMIANDHDDGHANDHNYGHDDDHTNGHDDVHINDHDVHVNGHDDGHADHDPDQNLLLQCQDYEKYLAEIGTGPLSRVMVMRASVVVNITQVWL